MYIASQQNKYSVFKNNNTEDKNCSTYQEYFTCFLYTYLNNQNNSNHFLQLSNILQILFKCQFDQIPLSLISIGITGIKEISQYFNSQYLNISNKKNIFNISKKYFNSDNFSLDNFSLEEYFSLMHVTVLIHHFNMNNNIYINCKNLITNNINVNFIINSIKKLKLHKMFIWNLKEYCNENNIQMLSNIDILLKEETNESHKIIGNDENKKKDCYDKYCEIF